MGGQGRHPYFFSFSRDQAGRLSPTTEQKSQSCQEALLSLDSSNSPSPEASPTWRALRTRRLHSWFSYTMPYKFLH